MQRTDLLILIVALAVIALGLRWIYREFLTGGSVRPTEGTGPHRRPYISAVIRSMQDKEDEANKERP